MLAMSAKQISTSLWLRKFTAAALAAVLAFAPAVFAARTKLKPGFNLYSAKQDVELGLGAAQEAEKQLPLLNDSRVDRYVDALGKRLAALAPHEKYPYQFKVINDLSINAFALPGGYIYVHRGIIESATNEAELAGVIGHEIGHVALRHGTNQASKAALAQGLVALGGAAAGSGVGGAVAQMGGTLFATGVLLKYGRDAERQSDIIGTQLLYDAGYDPRAMAHFFEKLEGASKGKRPPELLSSHPNPGNRMRGVMTEIDKIGPFPKNAKTDSPEFRSIQTYVKGLPAPPKAPAGATGGAAAPAGPPAAPATRMATYSASRWQMQHPENWKAAAQEDSVAFIPDRGVIGDAQGNGHVAYGVISGLFKPTAQGSGRMTVEGATDLLIEDLRKSNPKMRVYRRAEAVRAGRDRVSGLSTVLINDSLAGGREYDWLVTFLRQEGLVYFVFVVPEKDAEQYDPAFQAMLNSLRFTAR